MRLDKYLKVARLVRRRTAAKEICEQGRVKVNERTAKAGTEVKVGDKLVLELGQRIVTVEVVEVREQASAADARNLYRVV
ncbi:MAG: S4 domain-containing protein [Bacillota bacterium]